MPLIQRRFGPSIIRHAPHQREAKTGNRKELFHARNIVERWLNGS
jgi:hypothetical protein